MKRLTLIIALLGLTVTSCRKERIKPSGDITTELRSVSTFDGIKVSNAIEVDVIQSAIQSVEVEANSNLHQYIVTEIISGKLVIRVKNSVNIKNSPTIRVKIYVQDLNALEASGASKLEVQGSFISNHINFEVSGASRLYGNFILNSGNIESAGASNINISGQMNYLDAELSGATEMKGFNMIIQDLDLDLSGASKTSLTVNGIMNIKASGASTFYYEGNGTISDLNLSGASTVKKN